MNETIRRSAQLKSIARLCAVLVLIIIGLSAYMRLSNAGLGCSDWPQCYGSALRAAQHGTAQSPTTDSTMVAARLAHRGTASSVLVLVFIMVMISFFPAPILWREARIALALLVLVLFLAVLGRSTSGARVPAVAMGNLLGGFALLALCWRAAESGQVVSEARPAAGTPGLGGWAWLGVAVVIAQVALGALVSASYAGLSCPGLFDCGGASNWWWHALNPFREPLFAAGAPPNANAALAQVVHRFGGVVTILVVAPLAIAAIRKGARRAGASVLVLLALQVGLGVALVLGALPMPLALAHNLIAALLLVAVVCLG